MAHNYHLTRYNNDRQCIIHGTVQTAYVIRLTNKQQQKQRSMLWTDDMTYRQLKAKWQDADSTRNIQ